MDVAIETELIDLLSELLANTDGLIPLLEQIRDSLFFISYFVICSIIMLIFYFGCKFINRLFR